MSSTRPEKADSEGPVTFCEIDAMIVSSRQLGRACVRHGSGERFKRRSAPGRGIHSNGRRALFQAVALICALLSGWSAVSAFCGKG